MPWIDITPTLAADTRSQCPYTDPSAPRYELTPGGFWRASPLWFPPGDLLCADSEDSDPPGWARRDVRPILRYTGPAIQQVTRFRMTFRWPVPASAHPLWPNVAPGGCGTGGAPGCWDTTPVLEGNQCIGCNSRTVPINDTSQQIVEVESEPVGGELFTGMSYSAYVLFTPSLLLAKGGSALMGDIYRIEVWSDAAPARFWTDLVGCYEL